MGIKRPLAFLILFLLTIIPVVPVYAHANSVEEHCGWFFYPSQSGASFVFEGGQWSIGESDGVPAAGEWPPFKTKDPMQFVQAGHDAYGYGCACLKAEVDLGTGTVYTLDDARVLPLSYCRDDEALKDFETSRRE